MKVSVIIPVYNTEAYLAECLDSLVRQMLEDMEILVVDDGSTDGSLKIAREFEAAHPGKLKVLAKENGGQASARNLALEYARGEYLGFVDSDDWVDTDMYQQMYDAAVREDADIVICDMEDHYPMRVVYHHSSQFENKFRVTPSACNKLFRRSIIGADLFPLGLWYEDFEFTTKQLMKTEKIATIHKAFYHCHCREVSTMHNNNSMKNLDIITVLENLEQFARKNGWGEKFSGELEAFWIDHALIDAINRVERQTSPEKKEVLRRLRQAVKTRYPKLYRGQVFRQQPGNRRLVAWLNGVGLSVCSKWLVDLKGKTKQR